MSNSNNQTNDIYSISDVEDLACDTAANIQGGAAMTFYRHANLVDWLGEFNGGGLRHLSSNANDQASSVKITDGRWKFYNSSNWIDKPFVDDSVELGPGTYNFVGMNDKISSFRRVG